MNYSATGEQLTAIADAIRAKTGGSSQLEFPTDFVDGIDSLDSWTSATATLPASDVPISLGETGIKSLGGLGSGRKFKLVSVTVNDQTMENYLGNLMFVLQDGDNQSVCDITLRMLVNPSVLADKIPANAFTVNFKRYNT